MLQACLNGARPPTSHPALPVSPDEIAADAAAVTALGVTDLHVHPKGPDGADRLDPPIVDPVVAALRTRVPGATVGVTTGAWAASAAERVASVRAWTVLPDHASVNWHEEGAEHVAAALLDRGVAVDAGLWSDTEGLERFLRSPLRARVLRVLLEMTATDPATAIDDARGMLARVVTPPDRVLLHGEDDTAWAVLREAVDRGVHTRIGLEDTLTLPTGAPAPDNAALVTAATDIVAG